MALKQNSNTDTQLTNAQENGAYDVVFAQIMQNELSNYMTELQQVYKGSKSTTVRSLMSTDYGQAATLLKQVPSSASLTAN